MDVLIKSKYCNNVATFITHVLHEYVFNYFLKSYKFVHK